MAERLIKTSAEWQALNESGQHQDLIVKLNCSENDAVIIDKAIFQRIEVCANTNAVIRLQDSVGMQIVCKGKSRSLILGDAAVTLTNRATGYAFDQSTLILRQEAVGYFYDESNADVYDRATAYIGDYATGYLNGEGTIFDVGTTGQISGIGAGDREPNIAKAKKSQIRKYENDRLSFEGRKAKWLLYVWQSMKGILKKNTSGK